MAKVRIIILFALSFAGCLSIVDPNRKYKAHLQAAERACSKADYAEAENEYRLAIDIAKHSPEEHKQFIALRGLAQVYASANRDLEAEAVFRQRIELGEKLLRNNPAYLGTVYDDLAIFYILRRRSREATPIYEQAIGIREVAFGPKSPEVVEALETYSNLLSQTSEVQQAEFMKSRLKTIKGQTE